jgi:hypothetical protein
MLNAEFACACVVTLAGYKVNKQRRVENYFIHVHVVINLQM